MEADNLVYAITKWIMERLLQHFWFRLSVNLLVLILVTYFLHVHCHAVPEARASYYQNVWIYSAYFPSFLITGMIFWYVLMESLSRRAGHLGNAISAAGAGTFVLFALLFTPALLGMDTDPRIYHGLALLIASAVLAIDFMLKETGSFRRMERNWSYVFNFDLGIILAILAILVIGHIIKGCGGALVSAGFTGGGVAFQLFMSNLLFDPSLYRIDK